MSVHFTEADALLLTQRILRIMARLRLLSEAPGGRALDPDVPQQKQQRGHGVSKPPPMASLDDPVDTRHRPPPRERSLFDHYQWRFDRAKELPAHRRTEHLEKLCMLAERDYWEHARRGRKSRPSQEIKEERNRRIVREYEGIPALEVAVFERIDTMSVRKVRKEFGRCAQYGLRAAA